MGTSIIETEAFIRFRLIEMSSLNEHHRFEEIATRVAQKRISANILIATGPVSSKGDQGRDAESFLTRIPVELPHSSGFAAMASSAPVVIACTLQKDGLKQKILDDLTSICHPDAAKVEHVAVFSAHPISEGITHELQKAARETYGLTLDIFCGADIATFLAQQDLVWIAEHYLQLPSHLVPEPDGESAPDWYSELLADLRLNGGPQTLTPAVQGSVIQGLRHATWDETTNADLPEWIGFMGVFLAEHTGMEDTEMTFRACYEMAVARFRGQGTATGIEDLIRRAVGYAAKSDEPNVFSDAVTLVSYWGTMWSSGVADAKVDEITAALTALREHGAELLSATDTDTHPIRTATIIGGLVFANLMPNWTLISEARGKPVRTKVAWGAGVKLNAASVDVSGLQKQDLVDLDAAMGLLMQLVGMWPKARAYSVSQLAQVFNMLAPVAANYPSYSTIRDGLDTATGEAVGDSIAAEGCRDRAMNFVRARQPLEALRELHQAKLKWFSGDTMYGAVLTMRYIARVYSDLGLMYAAKMYACTAVALGLLSPDGDVKELAPKALLEAARYAQRAGTWVDAARLTELALLARSQLLIDPFDFGKHPELEDHNRNAVLELAAIRTFWPDVEVLIKKSHHATDWYQDLADVVDELGPYAGTEEEIQANASQSLAGAILSDMGPVRTIDFQALGVRWIFKFENAQTLVLTAEAFCAVLQVILADIALHHPVLIRATVRTTVSMTPEVGKDAYHLSIDDLEPEITAVAVLPDGLTDLDARDPSLISLCFQLIHAVHVRPPKDLQDLIEPMFKAGLAHKASVGRPYEETAALLDREHYERCAAEVGPASSDAFIPTPSEALWPSRRLGAGYDQAESLEAIEERYSVANETLRFTLPRLLADHDGRATIERLKSENWLDWQILAILVNVAMNWRMQRDGIEPHLATPAQVMNLIREPETEQSVPIPLQWFSGGQLTASIAMSPITAAQRWQLRPRQQKPGRDSVRELVTRRYRFAEDDVPHLDILHCVDEGGRLLPFQ